MADASEKFTWSDGDFDLDDEETENHVHNAVDVQTQAGSLKMAVVRVQTQLVSACIAKVQQNAYDQQSDVVEAADKRQAITDLELALNVFYRSTMPLEGDAVIRRRLTEFGDIELIARPSFTVDREVVNYIEAAAERASKSHIDTVLNDVLEAVRKAALKGVSRDDLVSAIRREFVDISTVRAELIAKTETYRAFNRAQFDADRQFLDAVGVRGRAYKKWRTRSGNPCPFCKAKESEPPIPFDVPFAELGTEIEASFELADGTSVVRKLPVNYETIQSGNAHVNCRCVYDLIIQDE